MGRNSELVTLIQNDKRAEDYVTREHILNKPLKLNSLSVSEEASIANMVEDIRLKDSRVNAVGYIDQQPRIQS